MESRTHMEKELCQLTEQNVREISERYIDSILDYKDEYSGRGIVICCGGVKYFTSAWVCVNMLRYLGCKLPIQFWYLGSHELDKEMAAIVKPLNVECVNAYEVRNKFPVRTLNGWELKAYSIMHSPYKEVLLLDADNVAITNPEFLFDAPQYLDTGALFWPDLGRLSSQRKIWNLCGIQYRDEPEFESGQVLINKESCWKPLNLAMWYNEYSDFFYHHIHGDKETFHLAFRKLGMPYTMIPHKVKLKCRTMYQHDFDGNVIFQHRNGPKWNYHEANPNLRGFKFQDECLNFISQLKKIWDGSIGTDFSNRSNKVREAINKLTSQTYKYRRVAHDERQMTFLVNGKIGKGKAGCEQRWDIEETNENLELIISYGKEITCILQQTDNQKWQGKWLIFEKMAVELFPFNG